MKKGVIVFDIDGTILDDESYQNMATIATRDDPIHGVKKGQRFNVKQFASLAWRYDDMSMWDFHEWDDLDMNVDNIHNSDLIQANVDVIDDYRRKGYDARYLTARGGGKDMSIEPYITGAISNRLGYVVPGNAVGDFKEYGTNKEVRMPIKKQRVLRDLTQKYDEVVYMDDEDTNLDLAREIGGVIAIKALTKAVIGK